MGLLHYWPKTNSSKELMFLDEVGDILEVMNADGFIQVQGSLFRQLASSIASPNLQVARRVLRFWYNERFRDLVKANIGSILPIMFKSIYESSDCHWDRYDFLS